MWLMKTFMCTIKPNVLSIEKCCSGGGEGVCMVHCYECPKELL